MGHYTLNQTNNRFIGDIKIHNEEFNETYYGFENHQGRTFLSDDQNHWDWFVYGNGNNEEKVGEGVHYKNVFGSYFHGPILSRNANLAYRLVTTALKKNTDRTSSSLPMRTFSAKKSLKNTATSKARLTFLKSKIPTCKELLESFGVLLPSPFTLFPISFLPK